MNFPVSAHSGFQPLHKHTAHGLITICGVVEAGDLSLIINDTTANFQTFVFILEASPIVGKIQQIVLI
jgi:hypothetical protein